MLIRALTSTDIPAWLTLAHEADECVARLTPDIAVFYTGFNDYMSRKISRGEALMAFDVISARCLGIIAFSRNHNRITFLGITEGANFPAVGKKLLESVMKQLDTAKEITTGVLKSKAGIFQKERALYKSFGFMETENTLMEHGVPASQLKLLPKQAARIN
jgi:hypothetical protein